MLLKAIALSKGHSGVRLETIDRILWLYNNDVIPVIYELGSLGASGDLAPLAHMSLALIGEGEVRYKGIKRATSDVLKELSVQPIHLHAKEGLALLNGTQFMAAYLSYGVFQGMSIFNNANNVASITLDVLFGIESPFKANVNALRNQKGQMEVAQLILEKIKGSQLMKQPKQHVQDPYSLRVYTSSSWGEQGYLRFLQKND